MVLSRQAMAPLDALDQKANQGVVDRAQPGLLTVSHPHPSIAQPLDLHEHRRPESGPVG
jgi:hypothetical protein